MVANSLKRINSLCQILVRSIEDISDDVEITNIYNFLIGVQAFILDIQHQIIKLRIKVMTRKQSGFSFEESEDLGERSLALGMIKLVKCVDLIYTKLEVLQAYSGADKYKVKNSTRLTEVFQTLSLTDSSRHVHVHEGLPDSLNIGDLTDFRLSADS